MIKKPEVLREKVEERAARERRALQNTDREARRIRQRLDKLEIMEDGYSDQAAEGLMSLDRLKGKLGALAEERSGLEARLAKLAGAEKRIDWLEQLPRLVGRYLRDLPFLVGRKTAIREHKTVPPAKTEDNPLGLYTLTAERIRRVGEGGTRGEEAGGRGGAQPEVSRTLRDAGS